MGIPAGWYQDLEDAARLRWWDGEAWTSATRGREALDGPPTGPSERLSGPGVGGPRSDPAVDGREVRAVTGATPPDASHLTAANAAAAAAEVAARLAAAAPPHAEAAPLHADAAPSHAEEAPTLRPEADAPRATRTVRIDDRELGHLLDVVPEVPPHLLPLPPERRSQTRRAFRAAERGLDRHDIGEAEPTLRSRTSRVPEGAEPAPVPHVTLEPLGRSTRRARPTVRIDGRAPRAPLGRRAALRRTFATGGAVALAVVLAVGFLLDDASTPPQSAAPDAGAVSDIDPLLDEIPVVPELGAPGADGGPEGEAEAVRRVLVPLGGPCGTVEVVLTGGREATTLRAWDVPECTLAPVALTAGEQRWIVVRASLNGSAATEASARASAERAGASGLLWSSYYASLNPDLWVVFDGPFASRAEAEAAARAVGGGAYERVLSDDETDRYCIAPGGCTGGVPRD